MMVSPGPTTARCEAPAITWARSATSSPAFASFAQSAARILDPSKPSPLALKAPLVMSQIVWAWTDMTWVMLALMVGGAGFGPHEAVSDRPRPNAMTTSPLDIHPPVDATDAQRLPIPTSPARHALGVPVIVILPAGPSLCCHRQCMSARLWDR